MCGFAGLLTDRGSDDGELRAAVGAMAATLTHRGPDDGGAWCDPRHGAAVGFRRLAILDLSAQGHQPMRSVSGRLTMVFNGEVYNHAEIRAELERHGMRFRGTSDTEVVLGAIERWGVGDAVNRFVGMFAIAVWDEASAAFTLARDRMGIKPLFVYAEPGLVTFGSELKALVAGPAFDRTLDTAALVDYLRYLYIPAPATIYRAVRKLLPGHLLTIRDVRAPLPGPVPYWSVEQVAARGAANPFPGSDADAVDELDRLLSEAVRLRMQADVPLGALLSGGIDSSLVVALLQEQASRPLKTFAVGFDRHEHDESRHAGRVAAHLGTDHTEVRLTGEDALAVVPRLPEMYDEPLADASQIPAHLVCAAARRDVVVALSGDGGDEVFGGYNRYTYGDHILQRVYHLPRPARMAVAAGITRIPAASWDRAHRAVTPVLPAALRQRFPGEKLHKLGRMLRADAPWMMYRSLLSAWQDPERLVVGAVGGGGVVERILAAPQPHHSLDRMLLADQTAYLIDNQLAKVDRASMALGLELRVPLLDHRVVEFSWRLPSGRFKVRGSQGKWILRQVLYRRVPKELIERPKFGFSVPLDHWLRGSLREWASDLLSAERLEREGIFHPERVRRAWESVLQGRDRAALGIWGVLVFQAWNERWRA